MADKKVDAATGEVKQEEEGTKVLTIHCKPVYNYQSVEFDWNVYFDTDNIGEQINAMEWFYSLMLQMLVRVSQNAPQKDVSKPVAPVEEPASEKQKEILRNFHIDFKPDITKKQAHALIKKSMDQEIF